MYRIFLFSLLLGVFFASCDSSTDANGTECEENPAHLDCNPEFSELTGTLYYGSGSKTLMSYVFETQTETSLYKIVESGAYSFMVFPEGDKFAWPDQYNTGQGTWLQIHDLSNPGSYEEVLLTSANLRHTYSSIELAPAGEVIGALEPAEESSRNNLILFDTEGNYLFGYPFVKDFAFAPNGTDLVLSMEVRDGGTVAGYAVGVIRNYRSEAPEAYVVKQFADYGQLPEGLSVSPNSSTLAYAYEKHIYTVSLQEGTGHHQITTSGSREWNVRWSPDGNYLAFMYRASGTSDNMGRVVIVPVHTNDEPVQIRTNVNHDVLPDEAYAPFPLGLETGDGRVVAKDPGPFWIP